MEVFFSFEDEEVKLYALNNVGATALSGLLKYYVKNRTFTDNSTKGILKTSTNPEKALSQYLKFRRELQDLLCFDINNVRAIYTDNTRSVILDYIQPENLDNSLLKGILQYSPYFPTCIAKYREDGIPVKCRKECSNKCCDACDHMGYTCESENCTALNCNDPDDIRSKDRCSSCNKTLLNCIESSVVCCDNCMLCLSCKIKTAADLCPNEEMRNFVDIILKSRTFSVRLGHHIDELRAGIFKSDDFPDCSNFHDLLKHVRRSIEGVLKFLRKTKQFSQIEYEDQLDRIFEIQMKSARNLKQDHYVCLCKELNALDHYTMLKLRSWPHIQDLRVRRHYLTLTARKKSWFSKKYEDFSPSDVGLFCRVTDQVSQQVKAVFRGELGAPEDYLIYPVRCIFKEKYQYSPKNNSLDVMICFRPVDGQNELPPEFGDIQSNENMQLWKTVANATTLALDEELHIKTSFILTQWDFSVNTKLFLQTTATRETGGEFSPCEEVIVMECLRKKSARYFRTPNVDVEKQPIVYSKRDSVCLQFQIDTKTEGMLDYVNHILRYARDCDFIKL